MIHSSAGRDSTLCMVRTTFLRPDQLTFADVIPGRLQHIRLYLTRVHDIFNIYQVAWNTAKPRDVLLKERTSIWKSLQEAIKHVPKNHMLLIAGDCNTPLNVAPPAIESGDAKYGQAAQSDKQEFQRLVHDLDLCAPHCRGKWQPTFQHGTHSSRIDFMFLRAHQHQGRKHQARVLTRFERSLPHDGPQHRPLIISLPRWFAPPRRTPKQAHIDRQQMRQDFKLQNDNWQRFEHKMNDLFHQVTTPTESNALDTCMTIEQRIRDLCVLHFAPTPAARLLCPQVRSMSAQMWFARRQLLRSQPCTLTAVFTRWHHVTKFEKLHKLIRKQSRLNRKNRLTTFLEESVPLVLRNQMHEWYKRIRTLCPKQPYRRIQMFESSGAPMSQDQELARLVEYFQTLFTDVHPPLPHPPPLQTLPFTEEDVQHELERLPITKALAPDGFPALIWKQFAPQLTPIIYACIRQAWTTDPCTYCPNQIRLPTNRKHSDRYVYNTQLARSCLVFTAVSCNLTPILHSRPCLCTRTWHTEALETACWSSHTTAVL